MRRKSWVHAPLEPQSMLLRLCHPEPHVWSWKLSRWGLVSAWMGLFMPAFHFFSLPKKWTFRSEKMCSKAGNINKEVVELGEVWLIHIQDDKSKDTKITVLSELIYYFSTIDVICMLNSDSTKRLFSSYCLSDSMLGAPVPQRWTKPSPHS